jgi:hypothetical protein
MVTYNPLGHPGICHRAILPDKVTTSALVVHAGVVEGHVDGIDGGVVVSLQKKRLLIRGYFTTNI